MLVPKHLISKGVEVTRPLSLAKPTPFQQGRIEPILLEEGTQGLVTGKESLCVLSNGEIRLGIEISARLPKRSKAATTIVVPVDSLRITIG